MADPGHICVLGGSFDPVHIGHLILADRARHALGVTTVTLMPAARSPGKAPSNASDGARLEMLARAVEGHGWLRVSDLEIRRGAPSYTIDTVGELLRLNPGSMVTWVVGMDQFAALHRWHRADDLVKLCGFAVACRPGLREASEQAAKQMALKVVPRAWIDMPMLDISSSDIRSRIGAGLPVTWMVPDAVLAVIAARGLYR